MMFQFDLRNTGVTFSSQTTNVVVDQLADQETMILSNYNSHQPRIEAQQKAWDMEAERILRDNMELWKRLAQQ